MALVTARGQPILPPANEMLISSLDAPRIASTLPTSHLSGDQEVKSFSQSISPVEAQSPDEEKFLIVSPYTDHDHLLDLRTLNNSQQLLAKALTILTPLDEHYATWTYATAFNWSAVTNLLRDLNEQTRNSWTTQSFYIVVFRSRIPPTTDRQHLGELDRRSHAEATKSGGLLKYWFGVPDVDGRNLATCIWRDVKDVIPASAGNSHRAAARATIHLYTEWKIERLRFIIHDDGAGGVGNWAIEEWDQ